MLHLLYLPENGKFNFIRYLLNFVLKKCIGGLSLIFDYGHNPQD